VIENRAGPRRGSVAKRTGGGKARCGVVRIVGSVEFLHVARAAIHGQTNKFAAHMALPALDRRMRAGERKWRVVVIEAGALPLRGGVTGIAGGRKPSRHVIWTGGLIEILQVTARAVCGSGRVRSGSDVALRTTRANVRAR